MKVKELIKKLSKLDQEKTIYISSDEELNTVFTKYEICEFIAHENQETPDYIIFGFSGHEIDNY